MNRDAKKVVLWTQKRLLLANRLFLKKMKVTMEWQDMLFCHANPYRPLDWIYIAEKTFISRAFARSKAKILFLGHTHTAAAITRKNFLCIYVQLPRDKSVIPAALLKRQIFNCGSIGQPRDGDPRASYLIYDTDKNVIEFYRVPYDRAKAANKVLAAGLPKTLALRLLKGI